MEEDVNLQRGKVDSKVLTKPKTNQTPQEFLLFKERELGRTITPRFREYFFRELKAKGNNSFEEIWRAVNHGN
ncbi:hypothetical protein [Leptospira adleri]|uniref:Uncharacterized protein n=1 Tax=Leptospira adleri TaxID=2023186 RepID=A0A2M9YJ08_9LEPT|nr:hypothetical protein [Leptospira adleri]PJZ51529.1 hypothetical protein CH380_19780 [Leptospira adleri]PJZ60252.1 hypothetical protein CH376_19300 [Leptospira adleri]